MTHKNLNEQELQEIMELAKKAEQQAKQMCEVIITHAATYEKWCEETKNPKVSLPLKSN
ncbi:hypothetical protein [Gloeothece verrucosa]|uniref:Uncharacterized protein n=1 Tax=Gloeothece verrucosa (strain PCC 7822) TaxID=497965 RepID=E0UHJ2_GLOV7|nr:hypothetical protein [Gloeothece verrucosa]ADN12133.1 hypothetical protein Cyan7822_0081 [Gloeothece verrucosa PCC 7822]